jgi:hypothetical protein
MTEPERPRHKGSILQVGDLLADVAVRYDPATPDGFRQYVLGHRKTMNPGRSGTGSAWSANDPVCRVVWNAWTGEIEGVAVWSPQTWSWDVVRPTGEFAGEVRAACASTIGEEIVNAIWSGAGIKPPAGRDELLNLVEALLDPQILILKLVQATAQVAAIHAGFPLPVAHLVGNLAQQICKGFLGQDPKADRVQAACCVDFAFSAQTGSWIGSSGLRELATDQTTSAIDKLLGPDGRNHPPRPAPAAYEAPVTKLPRIPPTAESPRARPADWGQPEHRPRPTSGPGGAPGI